MQKNPYDLLQIEISADTNEIRAAFRRRASTLHPDAGGDPEAFKDAVWARDLLLDPTRRRRWDETGIADDSSNQNSDEARAMEILAQCFQTVLNEALTKLSAPETQNLRDSILKLMAFQREQIRSAITSTDNAVEKVSRLRNRFRRIDDGPNILGNMIETEYNGQVKRLEEHKENFRILSLSEELASEFIFDVDRSKAQFNCVGLSAGSSATTSSVSF